MLLSQGVAGTEISLFLQKLEGADVAADLITDYCANYTLPKADGQVDKLWFSGTRRSDDQMRTPSASDHITMVALLNAFIEDTLPPDAFPDHTSCFKVLARLLDFLTLGPEGAMREIVRIEQAIVEHHRLFVKCYKDNIKPKAHNLLHLPQNMRHCGKLLACFVTERKHRTVKQAALHTFRNMERGVLQTLCNRSAIQMQGEDCPYKEEWLIGSKLQSEGVRTSLKACVACGHVEAGDIVLLRDSSRVARVEMFMEFRQQRFARIGLLERISFNVYDAATVNFAIVDTHAMLKPVPYAAVGQNLRLATTLYN
jgi:hypothetical protein